MRDPNKSTFNHEFFNTFNGGKPMSLKQFREYWKTHELEGDAAKWYKKVVTKAKRPDDENIDG